MCEKAKSIRKLQTADENAGSNDAAANACVRINNFNPRIRFDLPTTWHVFLFPPIRFFFNPRVDNYKCERTQSNSSSDLSHGPVVCPRLRIFSIFPFVSALINNCLKIRWRISVILCSVSMITRRRLSMFRRDSRNSNDAENVRIMKRGWIKYLLEKLNIRKIKYSENDILHHLYYIFLLLVFRKQLDIFRKSFNFRS